MLVLAVSDDVDEGLCHDVGPVRGVELILACGDLPFDYLDHLTQTLDVPLVFVAGNHDPDVSGAIERHQGLIADEVLAIEFARRDGGAETAELNGRPVRFAIQKA